MMATMSLPHDAHDSPAPCTHPKSKPATLPGSLQAGYLPLGSLAVAEADAAAAKADAEVAVAKAARAQLRLASLRAAAMPRTASETDAAKPPHCEGDAIIEDDHGWERACRTLVLHVAAALDATRASAFADLLGSDPADPRVEELGEPARGYQTILKAVRRSLLRADASESGECELPNSKGISDDVDCRLEAETLCVSVSEGGSSTSPGQRTPSERGGQPTGLDAALHDSGNVSANSRQPQLMPRASPWLCARVQLMSERQNVQHTSPAARRLSFSSRLAARLDADGVDQPLSQPPRAPSASQSGSAPSPPQLEAVRLMAARLVAMDYKKLCNAEEMKREGIVLLDRASQGHVRVHSLAHLEEGKTYETPRGNSLCRVSRSEALLAGTVVVSLNDAHALHATSASAASIPRVRTVPAPRAHPRSRMAAVVVVQRIARGVLARKALEQLAEKGRQEWINYHLSRKEYDQARELGWNGQQHSGECVIC